VHNNIVYDRYLIPTHILKHCIVNCDNVTTIWLCMIIIVDVENSNEDQIHANK